MGSPTLVSPQPVSKGCVTEVERIQLSKIQDILSKTKEDNKVDRKGGGTIYESQKQMDSYSSVLLGQDTKQ